MEATAFKDSEVQILYYLVKTAEGTATAAEVASYLGVKRTAGAMRLKRLLEKCKKEFGPINNPSDAAAADNSGDQPEGVEVTTDPATDDKGKDSDEPIASEKAQGKKRKVGTAKVDKVKKAKK